MVSGGMKKSNGFNMRMSDDTRQQLAAIADTFGVSRSMVITTLIETAHAKLLIRRADAQRQADVAADI